MSLDRAYYPDSPPPARAAEDALEEFDAALSQYDDANQLLPREDLLALRRRFLEQTGARPLRVLRDPRAVSPLGALPLLLGAL